MADVGSRTLTLEFPLGLRERSPVPMTLLHPSSEESFKYRFKEKIMNVSDARIVDILFS